MIDQTYGNGSILNEKIMHKLLQHSQRSQNLQHWSLHGLCDTTSAFPQYCGESVFCWQMHSTGLPSLCKKDGCTNASGYFNVFSDCSGCIKTGPQFEGQSHHRWVLEVHELGCVCCYRGYNYRYDCSVISHKHGFLLLEIYNLDVFVFHQRARNNTFLQVMGTWVPLPRLARSSACSSRYLVFHLMWWCSTGWASTCWHSSRTSALFWRGKQSTRWEDVFVILFRRLFCPCFAIAFSPI